MAQNIKTAWVGLRFKPVTTLTSDLLGEVQAHIGTSKTYLHNGTSRSPLVTETHAATLENKTISALDNTITDLTIENLEPTVLVTDLSLTVTDDQIPSALAVKTYVDEGLAAQDQASEISYDGTISGMSATNVQDAIDELDGIDIDLQDAITTVSVALQNHINDTTAAHAASAISVTPFTGVSNTDVQGALETLESQIAAAAAGGVTGPGSSTDNAITRFDGLTGKVVQNSTVTVSDVGVFANASIDATTNTISNISNTSIAAAAAIDATKIANGSVSNVEFQYLDGVSSAIQTQINSKVGNADVATFTNKTINAPDNTITNIANVNIATAAAIARSKLASGTNNAVVHNDASGVMTNSTDLLVGTNALTLQNTKHLELQAATDSTTTGANASLATFTAGAVRLTNASLVSLANIPAGTNGQELTLFNRTGVDVTIPDSSAAVGTAANRILSGTGSTVTFSNNSALQLSYDSTTARWQVIGGTGSGSGSASLDTIFQFTASEQLTDWSTGNNAAILGGGTLAGTFVKNTATPLHGTASYQYTQAAGSLNDYFFSPVTAIVGSRFDGAQSYLSFPFTYNGNTSDIQVYVYCATTSTILTSAADVVQGTNGANQVLIASALIPVGCRSIRFGFQVKVLNSGKVFAFDDVQLATTVYATAQLNNVTDWTQFSLTSPNASFTTFTTNEAEWRRNGTDIEIRGKFAATTAALEARLALPNSLISAAAPIISSIQMAGPLTSNESTSATTKYILMEPSLGYFTIGNYAPTTANASFNKLTASGLFSSGMLVNFNCKIPIQGWSAGSNAIVTPTQQISSDTIPFTFKSTAIVAADPIGTYNVYTYAAGANNVKTISATRPTQTDLDMNTNGILMYSRSGGSATASVAGQPNVIFVKIGEKLKDISKFLYKAGSGRTISGLSDAMRTIITTASVQGVPVSYAENTGILSIDYGYQPDTTTSSTFIMSDASLPTSAYFVFNASTTPSISALPVLQPRIATLSDVKASGTAGGGSSVGQQTRTLNTLVDPTGIVTSLTANVFILQPGTYYFEASAPIKDANSHKLRLRNITAGNTALVGTTEFAPVGSGVAIQSRSFVFGEVTITVATSFDLQHYAGLASVTNGLGVAASSGDVEVYSVCKITKVK